MNRLHHLRDTLIKNIIDNSRCKELDFVLVNYNSQDGLDSWVKENLNKYILNGRLSYYHTLDPLYYHHSHANNLSISLAKGDIICIINADYFTGRDFGKYVQKIFLDNSKVFLTHIPRMYWSVIGGLDQEIWGNICFKKRDWERINGYDESMEKYSHEDVDFANRLEFAGIKRISIEESRFKHFIHHGYKERFSSKPFLFSKLKWVFINYKDEYSSELIYFYTNFAFERFIVLDNNAVNSKNRNYLLSRVEARYLFSINNFEIITGRWKVGGIGLKLTNSNGRTSMFGFNKSNNILLKSTKEKYYKITNRQFLQELIQFNYVLFNMNIMEKNRCCHNTKVNLGGFKSVCINKYLGKDGENKTI